jgi:hypothetical protein
MTKRTKKNSGTKAIWVLLLIGVAGAAALAAYVRLTPAQHVPPEMRAAPHDTVASKVDRRPADQERTHVDILTPEVSGTDLHLKTQRQQVPQGENPMTYAVNQFLKNSHIVDDKAKAIGVQVKAGVAYIDFTPSFRQTYGSLDERTLLQGICTTLGQFPNVNKVQFQVDGQPLESLGNVELTDPIDVIRPGKADSGTQANAGAGFGG